MCVVSNIASDWTRRIPEQSPWVTPYINPVPKLPEPREVATPSEIEELRAEVRALRRLLLAAKEYDRSTGQPECETEDKVALIKRLAELVGVDLSEVFGQQ